MPSVITNPADIGKGLQQSGALYEGVFTPISAVTGPSGEKFGPYGTYSLKIAAGDYVQPWTASSQGNLTIFARPHSDQKPVGRVIEEPLGFPQGIDPTSTAPITLSSRDDMRKATVEWLTGKVIRRVKVREAVVAGTLVGFSNTGSDWTTTSVPATDSIGPARPYGMLLDSSSAAGLHAVLIVG